MPIDNITRFDKKKSKIEVGYAKSVMWLNFQNHCEWSYEPSEYFCNIDEDEYEKSKFFC